MLLPISWWHYDTNVGTREAPLGYRVLESGLLLWPCADVVTVCVIGRDADHPLHTLLAPVSSADVL